MTEDAGDLSAALAGNAEAFGRLYDRHAAVVLSLCRRCSAMAEAEDAMQETFLRAYRKLQQLEDPAGFRSWLYAIARRVCSERRRSAERRTRHEGRAIEQRAAAGGMRVGAVGAAGAGTNPGDPVEQAEQLERLGTALDELPDSERLAIHLYYLESDPVRVASDAMGLSRSGFYKLLTRARSHLAQAMREAQPT